MRGETRCRPQKVAVPGAPGRGAWKLVTRPSAVSTVRGPRLSWSQTAASVRRASNARRSGAGLRSHATSALRSQNVSVPMNHSARRSAPPVPRISGSNERATRRGPGRRRIHSRISPGWWWRFTSASRTPQRSSMRRVCSSMGTPQRGSMGLGRSRVRGSMRVPKPAARTNAVWGRGTLMSFPRSGKHALRVLSEQGSLMECGGLTPLSRPVKPGRTSAVKPATQTEHP